MPGAKDDAQLIKKFLETQCGFETYVYENLAIKDFESIEIDLQKK